MLRSALEEMSDTSTRIDSRDRAHPCRRFRRRRKSRRHSGRRQPAGFVNSDPHSVATGQPTLPPPPAAQAHLLRISGRGEQQAPGGTLPRIRRSARLARPRPPRRHRRAFSRAQRLVTTDELLEEALRAGMPNDGRPAAEWLAPAARDALETRAAWLEEEAHAQRDAPTKARTLLTCSELRAILGDKTEAHALAEQAYELAPSLGLAQRQARMLMPTRSGADYFRALDAEATRSQTAAARMHSESMHVEALRAAGQDDAYRERLDRMATSPLVDPRVAVARAGQALGRPDSPDPAAQSHDDLRFAPIAEAVTACRRLRGARAHGSAFSGTRTPNELLADVRRALEAR